MFTMLLSFCLALAAVIQPALGTTRIEIFSDTQCKNSITKLNGPDGFNGQCTSLLREGNFSSFSVLHTDQGCAVTIYGPNTDHDICSGYEAVAVPFKDCYNSSWAYYSIDGCTADAPKSSSASASSTTAASTKTSSATNSATHHPHHNSGTNVGAIVGGVIGGVAAGAIVAAVCIISFLRYRRVKRNREAGMSQQPPDYPAGGPMYEMETARKEAPMHDPNASELPPEAGPYHEAQSGMVHELPEGEHAFELTPKSPVEKV